METSEELLARVKKTLNRKVDKYRVLQSPASLTAFRLDGEKAVVSSGEIEAVALMYVSITEHMCKRGLTSEQVRKAAEIGIRNAAESDG